MSEAAIFLDEFADFITVAHGHEDISENQIGVRIRHAAHRCFAIADGNYIDTTLFKRQHDHLLDVGIVVRDQNSGHLNHLAAHPHGDTPTPFATLLQHPSWGASTDTKYRRA